MADKNTETRRSQAILKILDEAIAKGPWDRAIFLQAIRNKLIEIRNRFKQEVGAEENTAQSTLLPATLFGRVAKRRGLIEVFVLLYNADGSNIAKWETILRSINTQVISRPIYRSEKEARRALRAATNPTNEAYVAVFVQEQDILPLQLERIPHDRYGNELLIVKEEAIQRENIHRFIHNSGLYEFENNKLIWQSAAEFLADA